MWCSILWWLVGGIAVLNIPGLPLMFHVRLVIAMVSAWVSPKVDVLEGVSLSMRVWISECDLNLHMNNASYFAVADLGRYALAIGSGLAAHARAHGMYLANGGVSLRFRRELKPLAAYTHVTRLHSIDHKWMYLEHRFEDPENPDRIHAIGYSRMVAKQGRTTVPPATLLADVGYADQVAVVQAFAASKGSGKSLGCLANAIDEELFEIPATRRVGSLFSKDD